VHARRHEEHRLPGSANDVTFADRAPTSRCITCSQQVPRTATAVGLLERLAALAGYQAQDSG
jgi:hypothetical protein